MGQIWKIINNMKILILRNKLSIILILSVLPLVSMVGQHEIEMSVPAPKGILVFAGMELADGVKVDNYTVERSYDKRQWENLTELKSPDSWETFRANIEKWKPDFGFQGLPTPEDLKKRWEKCQKFNVIDSMGYWAASTTIRLAAGIALYDQTAPKDKKIWYRVKGLKNGKILSENISLPVQYPIIPRYDEVTLTDKNVDRSVFYIKWQSQGSNPAPYFGMRYYEDGKLKQANGFIAKYNIGNVRYYVFQDSTRYLKSDRQYFLNPMDIYGNQGVATDIVLVSGMSVNKTFFHRTKAATDPKGFGVILSWRLQNTKTLNGLKVYKSDSFDGKTYELAATLPAADTTYTDRKIVPDKMYYYYLETVSAQNDLPQKSNIFFNAAYDKLKPIYPVITRGKDVKNGVTLTVKASEMNLAGVKIYRSDGFSSRLYPITDILKLTNNEVAYIDTGKVLSGERSYLYAAKVVNNSSVESDFSDTLTVHPHLKTAPSSPNRLSAYEENGEVYLVWDDVKSRHRATKGYNVYRRDLPGGKFALLLPQDSLATVPLFTDHTAQPARNYEYAVQTVDDLGGVSESMALFPIAVKEILLPVPTNVWLTQNAGKVTVQWSETLKDTLLKVNLYRYQRGSKPQLLRTFLPNERKYEDVKVKKGELYFYYTTFTNDKKNESGKSQEISIRVE